jgi:chemotaxis protein MotB
MSYLMILFLVLFTSGLGHSNGAAPGDLRYQDSLIGIQTAFGGQSDSSARQRAIRRENEAAMASRLQGVLDRRSLTRYAQIESRDAKIRLVLSDAIVFDSGRADLKESSRAVLAAVAEELSRLPNPVVVEGHTDSVPARGSRYGSNWELSMARAYSVLRFLEQHGLNSSRLSGIGYGENHPVGDNATPDGRRLNRRIEISLIRADSETGAESPVPAR